MNEYVWLFPVIFMLHEMEEICGFGLWLDKNMPMLKNRFPSIAKEYSQYSTEGFSAAVFEEFILLLTVSIISRYTQFYGIWFGGLIGFTLHLIIHIVQSAVIKKYIPALITSVLTLPPSIWLTIKSTDLINLTTVQFIIFTITGIAIMALNLKLSHMIMNFTTKHISKSEQ